ncbi:MAG: methylenetetrahydrofolate reductase [Pseudomonadota bacterium]
MTYDPAMRTGASAAMKIGELGFSYEVFPPRSVDAERQLTGTVAALSAYGPTDISVTYGAGGADRDRSLATVARLKRLTGRTPTAHLTCAGQTKDDVEETLNGLVAQGVTRIVALRGDAPLEGTPVAPGVGYADARALVAALAKRSNLEIVVAAYPEGHPKAASPAACLDALVAKFDAGADAAITQFCYDNAAFFRLRDALAARGIDKPLIPGILPLHDIEQVKRFARRCGARVPAWLLEAGRRVANDSELAHLFALSFLIDQVRDLAAGGVTDCHFYSLNRANLVQPALEILRRDNSVNLRTGSRTVIPSAHRFMA